MKFLSLFLSNPPGPFPKCTCFNLWGNDHGGRIPVLHAEAQSTRCGAWKQVVATIDKAIRDGREELAPLEGLTNKERSHVVTLPPSIERLERVRRLSLGGTHLVRIPPEIGGMSSLEDLDLYSSHCLHFLPYEVTRCTRLRYTKNSTRALYGNHKFRAPFPALEAEENSAALSRLTPGACSVCKAPLQPEQLLRRWITLTVGDVLPLLVNACSAACIDSLPKPPEEYVQTAHTGGAALVQPPSR